MLEYLGTFTFIGADEFRRDFHLWAIVDGYEVCAIHYGLSRDLMTASGEVLRADCDTAVRKYAFKTAEERWEVGRIDDEEDIIVIDTEDRFSLESVPWH